MYIYIYILKEMNMPICIHICRYYHIFFQIFIYSIMQTLICFCVFLFSGVYLYLNVCVNALYFVLRYGSECISLGSFIVFIWLILFFS